MAAKAESLEETVMMPFWLRAKAIMPGIRKMKTGKSLR